MRFCGQCGTRLKQICPACNFANPLDYNFCGMCGAAMPAAPTLTEPGQPRVELSSLVQREQDIFALPEPASALLEGERRSVTVILADVADSTALLEQMGSEAWVEMMNRVFQLIETEIYRFGGRVDQFRGDGLVAFFGATSAHEDDPERAVLAGLAMQETIKAYATRLAEDKEIRLRLRVGVNTGQVIVTSIGDSRQHREDTVMGEAVALAQRMEIAAEPGAVLVSENTYALVESQFEWEALGKITVKGLRQPIAVYRPLAPRAEAKQPQHLRAYGLSAPLIGRVSEFEALKNHLKDLEAGRGSIVMVTGEEGVGKSYLVNELHQYLHRNSVLLAEVQEREPQAETALLRPIVWLQGRCRSYNQAWPYSAWLELLWGWLGVHKGEPGAETCARLYLKAQALWGDQLAEYYPYLAAFLSLPLEEAEAKRIKYLDAEGLRQQFYRTIRSWVEVLARQGPLALVFGDMHWADVTTLDLLEYCLPVTDQEPILWLIVFRSDRSSTIWGFRHRIETTYPHRAAILTLPPLTENQSSEMIERLIGSGVLPEETRALILDKAEGKPYYIEELIYALIEQGVLEQDALTGQWRVTRSVISLDLPDSLQSLFLARLDSLSAEERHVLQMAAVIGSVFWSNVLQTLAGDATRLKASLTALQRAQLIYERRRLPELGVEYAFKSNLLRYVTYESILSAQRLRYHHQVAEYLEHQFRQEFIGYGMLAYHYRQAEERKKELFYTQLAAQQAKRVYANTEALALYSRALELLDVIETQTGEERELYAIRAQRFEALDGRREVYDSMGDFAAGRADAQALLPLARQLDDDPAWLVDALLQQPGVANWTNVEELQAGLAIAEEALSLARRIGDQRREMQCLIASVNQRIGLADAMSLTFAEQALELARRLDDQYYQARILITMSRVYNWSNEPERGIEYLQAASPICQALDNRMAEADLLSQIGLQFERYGDYYLLLTEYQQRRLQIGREIGHRPLEAHSLLKCGEIQGIYLGNYEAGLALIEEARAIWAGAPNERYPFLRMVQMWTRQANYEAALAALERARKVRVQESGGITQVGFYLVSAILYNALADETHLRQALEFTEKLYQLAAENPFLTQQYKMAAACESAAAYLGLVKWAATEAERQACARQALEASQTAIDIYERFGFTQVVECTSEEILFCHSQALAVNGSISQAAKYLQRAYDEMMRKYNLIPPDSPFRQTFLENIPLHRNISIARTQ
jgi:class 3 adenylate cyclase/energy-coupling factor transporter ATP-binding protein EcfA2